MNIHDIRKRLAQFASARNWDQFHSPKNLSMALAAEAAEPATLTGGQAPRNLTGEKMDTSKLLSNDTLNQ